MVLGFAVYNTTIAWLFSDGAPLALWEEFEALIVGTWVFEPILLAAWAALGPGRLAIRVSLIVPCLTFMLSAPGLHRENLAEMERHEFVALTVAAMAVLFVTTLLMLIARRFTGWRIERGNEASHSAARPFQFDTRYLLMLVSLYAVALGLTVSLKFGPPKSNQFFGPNFVIYILAVGSAVASLLILPVIAVPMMVLTERFSKKYFWRAIAFWLVITLGVGAFWISVEGNEPFLFPLLIQLGAAIVGVAAALPLRWAGCRLVRHTLSPAPPELTSEPQ
jgi:hypothetical protein